MAEKTLIAKVLPDEKNPEGLVVVSPVVGMADGVPKAGIFLQPVQFTAAMLLRLIPSSKCPRWPLFVPRP